MKIMEKINYVQAIEGTHQYTLYGLKLELQKLLYLNKAVAENSEEDREVEIKRLEHILVGIDNSIKDDKDILPNVYSSFHSDKPIPTEVLREGVEVFGTEEEFKEWYLRPNAFHNFKKPSELTTEEVLTELGRIKNGIV